MTISSARGSDEHSGRRGEPKPQLACWLTIPGPAPLRLISRMDPPAISESRSRGKMARAKINNYTGISPDAFLLLYPLLMGTILSAGTDKHYVHQYILEPSFFFPFFLSMIQVLGPLLCSIVSYGCPERSSRPRAQTADPRQWGLHRKTEMLLGLQRFRIPHRHR